MKTKLALRAALAVAAIAASTASALAHTGIEHSFSFAAGVKHPLTGLDHLLAMVAVGLWAGLNGGRALWAWPVAFVGVMLAGGVLGMAGVPRSEERRVGKECRSRWSPYH